jgi:hypothetical protein
MMKSWHILACLMLIATMLTACGGAQATESNEADLSYESDVLDSGGEDGLDAASQLALGTLMLEETDHAVTSDQARTLLPLWQALQGGVTEEDEITAVLRGIEGAMTEEQLAAIADMALNQEGMQSWMETQGMGARGDFPGGAEDPDARATRQAEGGGEMPPGGDMPPGGEGMPPGGEMPSGEDMSPEMATRRAEFESMSEEEREAMMATAQAGGGVRAGFRGGAGEAAGGAPGAMGQLGVLLRPLITMLEARAGEA